MTRRSLLMQPIQAAPSAYALTCRRTVSGSPRAVNAGREPPAQAEINPRRTTHRRPAGAPQHKEVEPPQFRPSGAGT